MLRSRQSVANTADTASRRPLLPSRIEPPGAHEVFAVFPSGASAYEDIRENNFGGKVVCSSQDGQRGLCAVVEITTELRHVLCREDSSET